VECVERSSIEDGGIAHVEGCGLELARRCVGNVIEGNEVWAVGGNG